MSFIWHPPQSTREAEEVDSMTAALHAAFNSLSGGNHAHPPPPAHDSHHEMPKSSKHEPTLEIQVASDVLCLRGTGVDVNPALLSGNVVLHLHEATSLKQIVLQFKGKARIPASASESISLQSNHIVYLVCNHEWSFLEGAKNHSHTLKAGRHLFPFQLHLGGSLPSSVSTTALGGASVHYKLRATAIRSGFFTHRDITATCPIYVLRGLGSEALEYQQTLEIENTWPEKLMYSIMLPHKAWAAGEKVTAVVKFSPLVKGARVLHVTTTVNETIKLYGRSGCQEATRVVTTARHDIVDGKAVLAEEHQPRYRIPLIAGSNPHSLPSSPRHSAGAGAVGHAAPGSYFPPQPTSSGDLTPLTTTTTNSSGSSVPVAGPSSRPASNPNSRPGTSHGPSPLSSAGPSSSTHQLPSVSHGPHIVNGVELPPEVEMEPSSDVISTLSITIPENATPSHSLEPIQITHRIRWSILIGNRDGHTSELRCSLPLLVLDHRLLEEARAATLATRRLLLGSQDVEGGTAVDTNGENQENEDDMELPSYNAHVRDRVANAFLPETGVMRVANPWVVQGISPVIIGSGQSSGLTSPAPLEAHPLGTQQNPLSQLPSVPSPGSQQLNWVNSELLLSMTQNPETPAPPPPPVSPPSEYPPPAERSTHTSRFPSRFGSRASSRANSRAPSPERHAPSQAQGHGPAEQNNHNNTYVHNSSTASRHLHGLFHVSMKPFSSLASGFTLGSRNSSRADLQQHFPHGHSNLAQSESERRGRQSGSHSPSPSSSSVVSPSSSTLQITPLNTSARPVTQDPLTGPMLLHRAFTQTPDYEVASRGFLGGGVPPLDSMRGLPSYEEAAASSGSENPNAAAALPRSRSVPDIAGGNLANRMMSMSPLQVSPLPRPPQTAPASPEQS